MQDDPIVIVSARRTAIGAFNGGLKTLPAHQLGSLVIQDALNDSKIRAEEVDEIILGQVLTAGAGQNPARQAAIAAGIAFLYGLPLFIYILTPDNDYFALSLCGRRQDS